ncbi:Relaxase/mobilization nuclease family protein [mine drainage metagenome]|uniref:Relaxase/mobilization nuclease family protein n=1 Tax=mine drainage metagenome TaxID=410659 RepID=T0ZSR1_9ZZZZ
MIGKVITLNKKPGGARRGFGPVVAYVARDAPDAQGRPQEPIVAAELGLINLDAECDTPEARALIAQLMNATAARSKGLRTNPAYHVALSWRDGEHPTIPQVDHAVAHVMKALGMTECQALWALHRDTDQDHVHVVMNRVHPDKGIVLGPPRFDYRVIDKACRELELAQGWQHTPGPYVIEGGPHGPVIVRRSRRERYERGLLHATRTTPEGQPVFNSSQQAERAARNQGVPSFQDWVTGDPARALHAVLQRLDPTWAEVHRAIADYGVRITREGTGMIVTTTLPEGRILTAKASQLGRTCSKARLEQRLGPYRPPLNALPPARETYLVFLARVQRGTEPEGRLPEQNDEDPQRSLRRTERAEARQALYERFKTELKLLQVRRHAARQALAERHRQERAELKDNLTIRRTLFKAEQKAAGVPLKLTASLWAFEAAKQREAVQKRHRAERQKPGDLPRSLVWRQWLEQQAGLGDEAAKSALRGIRYREQRKQHQSRNGLEGEDIDPLQPVLSSLHAEIDHRHQRIHYRDAQGNALFTDTGPRIEVHDTADATLEAALRVAAQKFGGRCRHHRLCGLPGAGGPDSGAFRHRSAES